MYTIAEIGQAHEGSLGMAHSYIDALAKTGVSAIKFQMHIAEAESSIHEPFRVNFSYEDASRYDYWKRMEFTFEQWEGIKRHCDEVGLDFICSPFSNLAVDWLEKLQTDTYKVGSGEVLNFLLLDKIVKTGKPLIISSGMSNFTELDATITFLKERNHPFSILQCTTAYPTQPENYGLNVIKELKERYEVPVGFSDHSASVGACIAATALGAEILEFHAVFDKKMFGPDAKSSLTIDEISHLVTEVNKVALAIKHPVNKNYNTSFADLKTIFEKSLAVNKDLPKGHILSFDDLEAKKPRDFGINARDYEKVIGQALKTAKSRYEFLTQEDI